MKMTNSSLTIRVATLADVDGVFPLAKAMAMSFTVNREAFEKNYREILRSPTMALWVAVSEHNVIMGYALATYHPTFFANGRVAWLEEIAVVDSARRNGIGRGLMQAAEQWAKTQSCVLLALATRRADDFYEALEYERSYYRKYLKSE